MQVACERRLVVMETTLRSHGQILGRIETKIDRIQASNGRQNVDIALLKSDTRRHARLWGLIAGGVGTLIAGIVLWLVTK